MHEQAVVEPGRLQIADVRLQHDRLDAEVAQLLIAAGVPLQVVDARDLEPHEVVRVVGDALRVRLREADTHLGCETEPMHEGAMLAELISGNQPCVVLTGAGVSTESGIPDFRSPTGIWARVRPVRGRVDRRLPARPGAGLGVLRAAARTCSRDAQPNPAHRALARARGAGAGAGGDHPERRPGCTRSAGSRDVIEVHGSIATASCPHLRAPRGTRADSRAAAVAALRRLRDRAQAGRRHVRRAAAADRDRPCVGPRPGRRAAARRRLLARGLAGRGPSRGDARREAGASRSSTGSRRRTICAPHSCCTAPPERYSMRACEL